MKKELAAASNETASRLADAERRAQAIVEEAKARATEEVRRSSPPHVLKPSSKLLLRVKLCASKWRYWLSRGAEQIFARKSMLASTQICSTASRPSCKEAQHG